MTTVSHTTDASPAETGQFVILSTEEGSCVEMTSVPQSWDACMLTANAWVENFGGLTLTIVEVTNTSENQAIHEEYVMVLQGKHSGYRFGSDRIANAAQYLSRNAAWLVDFQSKELHSDKVKAVREEAMSIAMYRPRAIHCPNCGAVAGEG